MAQKRKIQKVSKARENLEEGYRMISRHTLFGELDGFVLFRDKEYMGKETAAYVTSDGDIILNRDYMLEPKQWAYAIAHCMLHLAFGHFDAEKMPGYEEYEDGTVQRIPQINQRIWNLACDIYIAKFLADMKFGIPLSDGCIFPENVNLQDERAIYHYLLEQNETGEIQSYGTAAIHSMDMKGLEKPIIYDKKKKERNRYAEAFADALVYSVCDAVSRSGGHGSIEEHAETAAEEAMTWFVNHYPLLGSFASYFKVVEDWKLCQQEEISIAAIDVTCGEVYINPAAKLSKKELRFVMAHELLHAGLCHQERCQGRDPYLWNVACDFVINGWLREMQVGDMPQQGLLYDEKYKDWSAERIYDELITSMRKNSKMATLRGYGQGDILTKRRGKAVDIAGGMSLDEFCRSALAQGLEYHQSRKRGYIPAGLIEEIRTLSMPPIPWDVQLARWLDGFIPPLEKLHTYARPSRRQGTTPEIPRPRYVNMVIDEKARTFGVVIDTSGSMSHPMLGMALGSIASYAAARDVPCVRVVFCDASAYDAGYMIAEEIAGRVEVKGRGGTWLQPGVDLLENTKDFPKDGPILLITDGMIEDKLAVHHEHAFLLPAGSHLPFHAKGKVFYFAER